MCFSCACCGTMCCCHFCSCCNTHLQHLFVACKQFLVKRETFLFSSPSTQRNHFFLPFCFALLHLTLSLSLDEFVEHNKNSKCGRNSSYKTGMLSTNLCLECLNIYKARGKANFSSFINKNNRWAKCVLHSALLWIVLHSILQTAAPRTALSSSSSSCTRLAYLTQFYHLSCKLNRTFHQHH